MVPSVRIISGSHLSRRSRGEWCCPGRRRRARLPSTIRDGRIEAIDEAGPATDGTLDFGDALVLPGAVDVHVHTRSAPEEGIEACTRAAAAGGVTTIVDMPYDAQGPIQTPEAFAAKVADVEREAHVDVALWATVPPRGADRARRRRSSRLAPPRSSCRPSRPTRSASRGSPTASCSPPSPRIAAAGGLAGVHAENDEIVRAGIDAERAAGHGGDPLAHARSRPPVAEHEAIARCLELARATGVRLHVCHVSTPRGVALVRAARARGVDVSAESCPHYLLLDESELARRGGEAKINPPLRERPLPLARHRHRRLRPRRLAGASASAATTSSRSRRARPGVELIVPLIHDAFGPRALARLLCEAPARRFGLWPRKGSLLAGRRRRPDRARPCARMGDRPCGAGHARRLEPLRRSDGCADA